MYFRGWEFFSVGNECGGIVCGLVGDDVLKGFGVGGGIVEIVGCSESGVGLIVGLL